MEGLFLVYRLEEYGGLLQEGGGGLPVLLLRACSYKTKAEGWHQGNAPILFKGWISVFFNPYNQSPFFLLFLLFLLSVLSFKKVRGCVVVAKIGKESVKIAVE